MRKILHFNELPVSAFFFFHLFRTLQYLDIIMQQTYRIFLASSCELESDRQGFRAFINRKNNVLNKKGVFLELVIWEDISGEVYDTHKQNHYNEELKTCDIFIMLYWSKVGMYTNIEFDCALERFKRSSDCLKIFVFEKTETPPASQTIADKESLRAFKKKFNEAGQFAIKYQNASDLINEFGHNLDKLFESGYLLEVNKNDNSAVCLYTDGHNVPIGFVGRTDELKSMHKKLHNTGSLMLINAEGGIGKTSLAAKYWKETLYSYKYNAWLFCDSGIVSTIKKLAPGLGVDLAGINEAQQTDVLKRALMPIAKDMLLVLDNANTADDIKEFRKAYRGVDWHVLFTSRCHGVLEQAQELHIEHLPPEIAKQLFKSNYKEDTPEFEDLLDKLLAAIGYHTLLTELFSKNLAKLKGTGETLEKFLNGLETKGLFLKERSFDIPTDYTLNRHVDATDTDSIIEILYDFKALEEIERYYLVNLALLPAVNYELKFLKQLFDQIELLDLKKILQGLYQRGWLGYTESGYRLSPVVQQLVIHKNKNTLRQDVERLVLNLDEILRNDGKFLNLSSIEAAPFVRLVPEITKNFSDNYFEPLGGLNDSICLYYRTIGDLPEALKAANKCAEINQFLANGVGMSVSYERLGDIYRDLGDLEKTSDFYKKGLKLDEDLYLKNPQDVYLKDNLSGSYERVGDVEFDLGRFENALTFYQTCNEFRSELHRNYPNHSKFIMDFAISYSRLGDTMRRLADLEKGLEYYQIEGNLILDLYVQLHDNLSVKNGLAFSFYKQARAHLELANIDNALVFCRKYNGLSHQLYDEHPDNIQFKKHLAVSHESLGDVYKAQQKNNTARDHYKIAINLWLELIATSPQMIEFKRFLEQVEEKLRNLLT